MWPFNLPNDDLDYRLKRLDKMILDMRDENSTLKEKVKNSEADNIILHGRLKDLERTVEILTGANGVLERELEQAKFRESKYIEKLFDTVGINRMPTPTLENSLNRKINLGRAGNWKAVQESLELKARQDYWEKKKVEEMAKTNLNKASGAGYLDKLEQEVLGPENDNIEGEEHAN